jgi:hypothetical protein
MQGFRAVANRYRIAPIFPPPRHVPEKWKPVFGKDHAAMKLRDHDPIQL